MKKSVVKITSVGIAALCFMPYHANAIVPLTNYLEVEISQYGTDWNYQTNTLTDGMPSGTIFSVSPPLYADSAYLFPATAETGQVIPFEPDINIYLDIVPILTFQSPGIIYEFNDVLRMTWLDSNFTANSMNTTLGIDPLIDQGVTDVDWFDIGVGHIKFMGVMAGDGGIDGGYDLHHIAYGVPPAVPVPAAVWLFGSGLIGLIGLARRKAQ